jgi:leucyl aminopeptidase (aminopeptidase T)
VATYPASIDGLLVADFAYNVNAIAHRDCRLHSHPVKVWIKEGRVARYECDDPETSRFLDECFRERHADQVGELGFGTNPFAGEAVAANSHINERHCGVHLGFGLHNQNRGVVERACTTRVHLDLIARGGKIWIDGDPDCLDLENLVPSSGAHPLSPRDEDVFSPDLEVDDCCGVLTRDGLQPFPGQKA